MHELKADKSNGDLLIERRASRRGGRLVHGGGHVRNVACGDHFRDRAKSHRMQTGGEALRRD
jgi:hypothetical protein